MIEGFFRFRRGLPGDAVAPGLDVVDGKRIFRARQVWSSRTSAPPLA
ncbi:MAG: hypothetical protein HY906_14835 [Deltaproteobacteria bacterium]|nr:hypothetical protein [Deltaproteobacteria bacterium]